MITQINHSLNLETINENDFSNIQILEDRDNVHFCYQNVPFHFSVGKMQSSDRAEVIYVILDKKVDSEEDIDFYWAEITYNLTKYDFICLAIQFPNLWGFHSEIVESNEKSITFYAHKEDEESEEIIYSLEAPAEGAQKVKLVFNKNVSQIFENLQNVKMNFTVNSQFTWARIESENIFLRIASMCVNSKLKLEKLTPTTEHNYYLFFDIEFSCIVKDGKAVFTIGNFTFEYEF